MAADDPDVRASSRISVGSCDAQLHLFAGFRVDASVGNESSSYNEQVGELLVAPDKPSSWWRGRAERLASAVQVSGELSWRSGDPLRNWSVMASANSEGLLDLLTDGSGTLTYRHEAPRFANQCARNPDPENNDVKCSGAGSSSAGIASYYIDLDAAGDYEIVIEGRCTRSGDAYAGAFVTLHAARYVGASADPGNIGPPNGPFQNFPDYSGGEFIFPQLLTAEDVGNICNAANGGSFSYRRVLEFGPPVVPGQDDLIYLQLGLGTLVGNNTIIGFDATEEMEFRGPFIIIYSSPPTQSVPTGSYQGEAQIEFTVQLNQR